jgi:hypothetical protein
MCHRAGNSGDRVRKIVVATGTVSTLAGSGSAGSVDGIGTSAEFNVPSNVAVAPDGSWALVVYRKWAQYTNPVHTICVLICVLGLIPPKSVGIKKIRDVTSYI